MMCLKAIARFSGVIKVANLDYENILCPFDICSYIFLILVLLFLVRLVTNYNDITHHFLYCIYVHLDLAKAKVLSCHF
jgi:hypothetical protein